MAKLKALSSMKSGSDKITGGFIAFLKEYGIIGLAIAVIIGGAVGKLVTALVTDVIMPIVTFFIPGGAWQTYKLTIGSVVLALGDFGGVLLDFLIIALVVYIFAKIILKEEKVSKK